VSEPSPAPDPQTGIQAEPPGPAADGIQAEKPAAPAPPSLSEAAFLARLRRLLDLHAAMNAGQPTPPMWGVVQAGSFLLGIVMAYQTAGELTAQKVDKDLVAVVFIVLFFLGMFLPTIMLRLYRRLQAKAARDAILDFIAQTARSYPEAVAHCGGMEVLADPLEIEALVRVLEQKFQPDGPPPPP
jgi:hypothetical protein